MLKFSTQIKVRLSQFSTFADTLTHRKITYRKIIFLENGNRLFSRIVWIFVPRAGRKGIARG